MIKFKMRTFSFMKKNRYTVNSDTKDTDSVAVGMKDLTLRDRKPEKQTTWNNYEVRRQDRVLEIKERHQDVNENGWYHNIPRAYTPGSCVQTYGLTQPARPDLPGTTDRKMTGTASGVVLGQTQTLRAPPRAGNAGLIQRNGGLTQAGWQMSSCSACAVVSKTCEGDYQSIKDLTMTSPSVDHDDVKTLRHDVNSLRHRLASTSSSSGVSSASEKSVASSLYASVRAILDKRKTKGSPEIVVTSRKTPQPERYQEGSPGNVVRITTKRSKSKSKWTMRSPKKVKSKSEVNSPVKTTSRGKSPARPRKRKRVVALARGLGCVGGARSRSVTPERHQMHRIHQLSQIEKQDLNLMLKNVQQRVRNIIEDGRDAVNDVDGESYNDFQNVIADDTNEAPAIPARIITPKIKSATLGNDVTGRRLSRWERHQARYQSPPDLSDVTCKRTSSMGRFSQPNTDIQKRPLPPIPDPPRESSVTLIKTLDLSNVMKNSWISGMAVNSRRDEIVLVDLEQAYVVDLEGNLKKIISNKNVKSSTRLKEPIDVCVLNDGTMVFSDHADRQVKLFNTRGQHLRSIHNQCHMNIAGVTCNESGQIFVAGTDSGCITVYGNNQCPLKHIPEGSQLEHPYSVAVNPLTGSVIVGDDYKQVVIAFSDSGKVLWRYCPSGERHFFPSSICVDNEGYIFIADLYNEKIYMLDSGGKLLKTLLSKGHGLHGGPGAIATDGKGHLYVADQEKSLKVFKYGQDGFAMYRRFSIVRK